MPQQPRQQLRLGWDPATPEAYRDQLVCGDAFKLARAIPDGSIDFILTDPVYQETAHYGKLARIAMRTLREKGALLAFVSKPNLPAARRAMERAGMEYVWDFTYTVVAKAYPMRYYHIYCWTTPVLWMQRRGECSAPYEWLPDTKIVNTPPQGPYKWNKNLAVLLDYLEAFTLPGQVIYDPFAGGASIPAAAKMLGRHFIASELQEKVARLGQWRLRNTPVWEHKQERLTFEEVQQLPLLDGVRTRVRKVKTVASATS